MAAAQNHVKEESFLKEYRFKILKRGDFLLKFSGSEIIVCSSVGGYRIYKVTGFDIGQPNFFKDYEELTINNDGDIQADIAVIKVGDEYRIYKVTSFERGIPNLDEDFCLVITSGIGKLQVFDTETQITITLPALESI